MGNESHDDAGVFRISSDLALVQTVDFFTPVVDDPRLFGRIAATNSLSDIYAMGGTPCTALNLLATPADVLKPEIVSEMLIGGQEVMDEAHTAIIGGHTIDDPEPKMGYAVTGTVHPEHIWRNDTAKVGEWVYLTKPVGTGVIVKAIKDGCASEAVTEGVVAMMGKSNREAKEAIQGVGDPGACTDVTGFGLLGHLWEMALGARVRVALWPEQVPLLPGALELAEADAFPAGSRRNWAFVQPHLALKTGDAPRVRLFADAVTSGGLLFSLDEGRAAELERSFLQRQIPLYAIGRIIPGDTGIELTSRE